MTVFKKRSLREDVAAAIGDFLYEEGFNADAVTKQGILEIINLIADYREEGNSLFPEVLVTNNRDFFETIPNRELIINEAELSIAEFKHAIKLCAPLAGNSWIIFIEVRQAKITYGLISAEMSETSPSIYNQTVGSMKIDEYKNTTIAYIRNIGQKKVELAGLKVNLEISLTLEEPQEPALDKIQTLSREITVKSNVKYRVNLASFFEKTIDDALKTGHGNLIGVVNDTPRYIEIARKKLNSKGGIYLPSPVDFEQLITESEEQKNNQTSINVKTYASLLKAMLKHDGITIISNKGRVLGYHLLINDYIKKTDIVDGGARSKAFKSMENCNAFSMCFFRSQDGDTKIWKKK